MSKSYSYLNGEELKDFEAIQALKSLERAVNYVMTCEIPHEEVDYWSGKLKRCSDHLSNLMRKLGRFEESFQVAELNRDKDILLIRLARMKLDLNESKTSAEKSSSPSIKPKSSNSDTQQDDAGDIGLCQDISSKLPEFHGENFGEWLKFSNAFNELVINNTQMPSSTKLNYLREKIKNKPRTLIAYLIFGPDSNFKLAWETLEKRYGNRRILFTSKLDCLLDMEVMKSDNFRSVQKMHDTAKECIYLIKKHLNRDIGESADDIFAHIIMRKMDAGARAQYEQYVRKAKSIQKLQDVMEFLEQQSEILENLENFEEAEPRQPITNILETM